MNASFSWDLAVDQRRLGAGRSAAAEYRAYLQGLP